LSDLKEKLYLVREINAVVIQGTAAYSLNNSVMSHTVIVTALGKLDVKTMIYGAEQLPNCKNFVL
jgi:hypothetical protein